MSLHFKEAFRKKIDEYDLKKRKVVEDLKLSSKKPYDSHFNFSLFENTSIPLPSRSNANIIFIFSNNLHDGEGDYRHAKPLAVKIKSLIEKYHLPYEIHLIVSAYRQYRYSEQQRKINARADYVKKDSSRLEGSLFDKVYYFEHSDKSPIDYAENELKLPSSANLIASFDRKAALFNAPFQNTNEIFHALADKKCFKYEDVMDYYQLAGGYKKRWEYPLSNVSLGLPREADNNMGYNGIWINPRNYTLSDRNHRLLRLRENQEGIIFLNSLLGRKGISSQAINDYFETHHFMPGYPQQEAAALTFVVSHLLKHKESKKDCDFHLPNIIDINMATLILQNAGFVNVELITPNSKTELTPTDPFQKRTRIFCGFRVDDGDYEDLYHLTSDGACASGDNSILNLLSSPHLPFFQARENYIRPFLQYELLHFIISCAHSAACPSFLDKKDLENLIEYFKLQVLFYQDKDANEEGLFSLSDNEGVPRQTALLAGFVFEIKKERLDHFMQYCETLANFQKDKGVKKAWQYIQTQLAEKYNYEYFFENIFKAALYKINPTPSLLPSLGQLIKETPRIKFLLDNQYLNVETLFTINISQLSLLSLNVIYDFIISKKCNVKILFALIKFDPSLVEEIIENNENPTEVEKIINLAFSRLKQAIYHQQTVSPTLAEKAPQATPTLIFSNNALGKRQREEENPTEKAQPPDAKKQKILNTSSSTLT